MARKSEREFIGGDVSDEEYAALNGDGPQGDIADIGGADTETGTEPLQTQTDAPVADGQPVAADAPQGEPEPKMVDVRALQEARAELRRRDEELRKRDEEFARADERMKLLQQAWEQQRQPTVEAPKIPSLEEEPLEHMDYRLKAADDRFKSVEEKLAAYEKAEADRAEQAKVARHQQALINEVDTVLASAGTKYADVNEAFEFAANGIKQEIGRILQQQGITGPAAIERGEQMLKAETLRLAQQCPRDPDQAAEFVRRNARWWGWSGPQQAQSAQQPAQAAQVAQPTVQQRQEQQQRHQSLSGVTGAEPPKTITAKELSSMTQQQYNELLKTVAGKKILEEQFGGY